MPGRDGMRVAYVLKKYPRLSETFILNEILGLEEAGVDVDVFSLNLPDDGRFHADLARVRADVQYLPPLKSSAVFDAFRALAETTRAAPDGFRRAVDFVERLGTEKGAILILQASILAEAARRKGIAHLHTHFMTVAAHVTYLAHLLSGIGFSVTAHAKDVFRNTVRPDVFAEVARAATAVVTVTEFNRRYIAENFLDGDDGPIVKIYNGLPLDDPSFVAPSRERERDLVLGVGRLVEKKGFDDLMLAARRLRDAGRPARVVLVGTGEDLPRLTSLRHELGLGSDVTFAGSRSREEVLDLMRRARVLAAPCVTGVDGNRDALPTVVIEALAMGLPVVSTRVNGIPEIVDDGVQGLLVDERDVEGLAAGLARLLDDDELHRACSAAGPVRARERFDRGATLPRLRGVFEKAAEVRVAGAAG